MQLTNHKIIITGATRGIGLALVKKLHALGNEIIAVARNKELLEGLKNEYKGLTSIAADLSDKQSVDNLISILKREHADANMLINNAGIQVNFYDKNFGQEPERIDEWKDEINVNFIAPIELTHALITTLMQNENPTIINVSSVLAVVPKKSAPIYCATKAGLHIFTKALRYEYENTKLKIFEILPPLVDTDMTEGRGKGKITPDQLVEEFLKSFSADCYEVNIGKTKIIRLLQRIFPKVADGLLKQG
jgi:uncharacterized oxidoreductase